MMRPLGRGPRGRERRHLGKLLVPLEGAAAGRASALRAALAGTSRTVPLGTLAGKRYVAHFTPMPLEGEGDASCASWTAVRLWRHYERDTLENAARREPGQAPQDRPRQDRPPPRDRAPVDSRRESGRGAKALAGARLAPA